jgi:hypothetical protein
MKTTIENIIASIPSLAAQLLIIGGALALVGTLMFALTFMWRRWASRSTERSDNRRPAPSLEIARPGRGKRGLAGLTEQLAAVLRFDGEGIAELFAQSGGLAPRAVARAVA